MTMYNVPLPYPLARGFRLHAAGAFVIAAVFAATPAVAAVTVRGATPEDGPRPGWFDRYSEMRQGAEQTEKVTQTFKVGDGASLDVSQLSGDIRVTASGGSEITVEATKRVRHRDADEARRLLRELRVEINNANGRVEVRTVYPRRGQFGGGISASVDFVISVPASTMVAVKAISGNVSVTGVKGEVRAEAISGDVSVSNTPNVSVAKAISGNVTAQNIGTQTTLVLTTISGTVTGSGLKVRALEAGSVSGNVRVVGSEIDRLEAKSVSGNIEFEAPLAKGGRYEFSSHSGNVRVTIAGSTGFELDADTFNGNVRSEIPVTLQTGRPEAGQRRGALGMGGNRAIRGSYGDASAFLSIRSHSGSVVISKK